MDDTRRIVRAWHRMVEERRVRLEGLGRGLPDPVRLLDQATQRLDDWSERLVNAGASAVERRGERLARLADPGRALLQLVAVKRHGFDAGRWAERMAPAARRFFERRGERVEQLGHRLDNLSYRKVLGRGYALVRDQAGDAVTRAAAALPGMGVALEFSDGSVGATIDGAPIGGDGAQKPKPAAKRVRGPSHGEGGQGSLL
jgi:exodeoxyribonuclease VII large subunit